MFVPSYSSRRSSLLVALVASAMFMVACEEEATITENTNTTQEEVSVKTEPTEGATAGTELPSESSSSDLATRPTTTPEKEAVTASTEVQTESQTKTQDKVDQDLVSESTTEEDGIPEWVKWQSPVLDEPTLYRDANTITDFSLYPKVDNTQLSEFDMIRYEGIGSVLAANTLTSNNLEFLMGYCYQSYCQETYHMEPNLIAADEAESEWSVEVIGLGQFRDDPATWDVKPAATQVLCSTTRPMVVDFDGEEYIINHISAGSPMSYAFSGLQEPDTLYWKVCHGAENLLPSEVPEFAASYGYDLNKEPRTVQQSFIELLEP